MKRLGASVFAAALLVSTLALAGNSGNSPPRASSGGGGGGSGTVTVVTATAPFSISSTATETPNVTSSMATASLLGRSTAGTGAVEVLSAATSRTLLGLATVATSASASDLSTGTLAAARIADGSLALAKLTGVDRRMAALIRAQALASSAAFDTVVGSDFGSSAEFTTTLSTGGTAPMSLTHKGGVVRQIVTTTQFSQSTLRAPGAASAVPPSLVSNARTDPWYMVARVNFGATSIQSGNTLQVQFLGSSGGTVFGFGARGNDSTTNFAYRIINQASGNVATTATAVALDAAWHTVEMVNDTSNFVIYLDGVSVYTVASSSIGTDPCGWTVTAVNNTAGSVGAAELDVDYVWVVTKSN